MIKIHILPCGTTTVDEALPFSDKSKNPLAFTGILRSKKHKIQVPVTSYLIEHPKALILVDTGWDTAIRSNALKYEGFFNYFASPGNLPAGQAVTEHLSLLGYKPNDLDYCILTHMDIDHAGGIGLVKNAKKIMTSKSELSAASGHNPRYLKRLWNNIDIETFPDSEYDLLGDGSIKLTPFHGHSAGLTGVIVKGSNDFAVISGDCGYGRPSWEKLVLPGITLNKAQALNSLKKLQSLAQNDQCKAILMTHDPEYSSGIIELEV